MPITYYDQWRSKSRNKITDKALDPFYQIAHKESAITNPASNSQSPDVITANKYSLLNASHTLFFLLFMLITLFSQSYYILFQWNDGKASKLTCFNSVHIVLQDTNILYIEIKWLLTDSWGKKKRIKQMTPTFYNTNSLQVPKMQNARDSVITKP